jgi:hypothetical protein
LYAEGHVPGAVQARGFATVSQTELIALQFVHAAPPDPHASLLKPTVQALLGKQQPPGQLPGPQRSRHCWPWQTWFVRLQFAQAMPPVPH